MRRRPTLGDGDSALPGELDLERAITEAEAAKLLGLAAITLKQMRQRGRAPRYFRIGRRVVRYVLRDVLDYREARSIGGPPR
jgi:predicted DNA-binding transcriptional regulator AlpA